MSKTRPEVIFDNETGMRVFGDSYTQRDQDSGWKLGTGLKHPEGSGRGKDELALELAKPESGSFILVSLRRRVAVLYCLRPGGPSRWRA
jgi:hypothetical protein